MSQSGEPFTSSASLQMVIPSLLSICGSSSIIFTFFLFKDLRRLRYIELVFFVSICSLVSSIGGAFGDVQSPSAECYFQDVVTTACNISAAFWTVVIAYQLWFVIEYGQTIKDLRLFHLFCWGFPIIVTFLPLSTNAFGKHDGSDNSWCFLTDRQGSPSWGVIFWTIMSFFVWILLSVVVMLGFLIAVFIRVRNSTLIQDVVYISLRKLCYYPLVYIVIWLPSFLSNLVANISGSSPDAVLVIQGMGNVCPNLLGVFLAVVFFSNNPIVLQCWTKLGKKTYITLYGWLFLRGQDSDNQRHQMERWMNVSTDDVVHVLFERQEDYIDDDVRRTFSFATGSTTNTFAHLLNGLPSLNPFGSRESRLSSKPGSGPSHPQSRDSGKQSDKHSQDIESASGSAANSHNSGTGQSPGTGQSSGLTSTYLSMYNNLTGRSGSRTAPIAILEQDTESDSSSNRVLNPIHSSNHSPSESGGFSSSSRGKHPSCDTASESTGSSPPLLGSIYNPFSGSAAHHTNSLRSRHTQSGLGSTGNERALLAAVESEVKQQLAANLHGRQAADAAHNASSSPQNLMSSSPAAQTGSSADSEKSSGQWKDFTPPVISHISSKNKSFLYGATNSSHASITQRSSRIENFVPSSNSSPALAGPVYFGNADFHQAASISPFPVPAVESQAAPVASTNDGNLVINSPNEHIN